MTGRDDEFLARTEPFAEPRGGGLEHGASGYAGSLRRTRRASRHNKSREAMHTAYVVIAGVMGTAVVAAAACAVLVFAGVFAVSPGVGGGHRTETLVKEPFSTTTDAPSPSTTTAPLSPGTTPEPLSPNTGVQTGRSPLPPSNSVAIPHTTAGAQVPAQPSLNSNDSQQLSSVSSPPPSDAPAPAPATSPAGKPTCHSDPKKSPKGQARQPSRCSRS